MWSISIAASPHRRIAASPHRRIADLERLVMPAILAKQFRIFYAPSDNRAGAALGPDGKPIIPQTVQNPSRPVGAVLWAMVSEALAKIIEKDALAVASLEARMWQSGNTQMIALIIAPFGGVNEMVSNVRQGTSH